jgi:hypothetical protein
MEIGFVRAAMKSGIILISVEKDFNHLANGRCVEYRQLLGPRDTTDHRSAEATFWLNVLAP